MHQSHLPYLAPFYSDKYAKIGFQVSELFEEERLKEKIERIIQMKNVFLQRVAVLFLGFLFLLPLRGEVILEPGTPVFTAPAHNQPITAVAQQAVAVESLPERTLFPGR